MNGTSRLCKWSLASAIICALSSLVYGQVGQNSSGGVPEDWTHHHVVFSNPGTFDDAMRNGEIDKWAQDGQRTSLPGRATEAATVAAA